MLNNQKIRIMTKLATFESKVGKEDLKLSKYYKRDYVRYKMLKTFFNATIGFLLIVLMIGMYNMEYLITNVVTLDYNKIVSTLIIAYLILIGVYVIIAFISYTFKFSSSRKRLSKYYKNLKELRRIYREEE